MQSAGETITGVDRPLAQPWLPRPDLPTMAETGDHRIMAVGTSDWMHRWARIAAPAFPVLLAACQQAPLTPAQQEAQEFRNFCASRPMAEDCINARSPGGG
jgi:hypothetical protein